VCSRKVLCKALKETKKPNKTYFCVLSTRMTDCLYKTHVTQKVNNFCYLYCSITVRLIAIQREEIN